MNRNWAEIWFSNSGDLYRSPIQYVKYIEYIEKIEEFDDEIKSMMLNLKKNQISFI